MKILYLSPAHGVDYLCDVVFHGLRELGEEVSDCNRLDHMYNDYGDLSPLYGRGFSLFGMLEEGSVDRNDIEAKIKSRYFDIVIYGSIQRAMFLLGLVYEHYPRNQIVFIDGEDNPDMFKHPMEHGLYFKRELHNPNPYAFPIQFGIPESKIAEPTQVKDRLLAYLDPWDPRTYIYKDEASYYRDYRRAMFARTSKKCGWDCMRHYEIMACQCLPYFDNLERYGSFEQGWHGCPPTIMTKLPKDLLLFAKKKYDENPDYFLTNSGKHLWEGLMGAVIAELREHMTTKAIARYVLDTVAHAQDKTPAQLVGVNA